MQALVFASVQETVRRRELNCSAARSGAGAGSRSRKGEALQAIVDLDLDEIAAIEPPRGFGRD
jgi:hypothetical protein